jgi:hypothetical protein
MKDGNQAETAAVSETTTTAGRAAATAAGPLIAPSDERVKQTAPEGQIAELTVQIARQRVIVRHALDTGQRSEMAESLLDALEGSLHIFEKHRIFLLSCRGSSSALLPGDAATGRSVSRRNGHG